MATCTGTGERAPKARLGGLGPPEGVSPEGKHEARNRGRSAYLQAASPRPSSSSEMRLWCTHGLISSSHYSGGATRTTLLGQQPL
eukprot:4486745-Alexandrium_andersonii.AAC.1